MFMAIGVAAGAIVIYIGVASLSFPIFFAGRILVGAAGESLHIVEGLFLRDYFSSNQMSFVIVSNLFADIFVLILKGFN
jgi:hypothetical protein